MCLQLHSHQLYQLLARTAFVPIYFFPVFYSLVCLVILARFNCRRQCLYHWPFFFFFVCFVWHRSRWLMTKMALNWISITTNKKCIDWLITASVTRATTRKNEAIEMCPVWRAATSCDSRLIIHTNHSIAERNTNTQHRAVIPQKLWSKYEKKCIPTNSTVETKNEPPNRSNRMGVMESEMHWQTRQSNSERYCHFCLGWCDRSACMNSTARLAEAFSDKRPTTRHTQNKYWKCFNAHRGTFENVIHTKRDVSIHLYYDNHKHILEVHLHTPIHLFGRLTMRCLFFGLF